MKQAISSLGKDSVIYGVGSFVPRFIGFFTLPLFTAYLTPDEYGVLAMLALLKLVIEPIFSIGMSVAMGPSYFEGNDEKRRFRVIWTAFSLLMISSGLLLFISIVFPELLSPIHRLPSELNYLVFLTVLNSVLTITGQPFVSRVQFEKQARLFVAISVISTIITIALSIFCVVYLRLGMVGMVVSQLVGAGVLFLCFFIIALRTTSFGLCWKIGNDLLRLGLPMVPSFAFLFVIMHYNKYIIESIEGLSVLGIYSVGFNIGSIISVLVGGVATAWYPFFISYIEKQEQIEILFGRVFTCYVFGMGFVTLMFFIFAKPLLMVLVQEEFHDAYKVIGLVAAAYFFQGFFNMFLPGIYYFREVKYIPFIQGVAALISVIASHVLILYFGLVGAAIALVIGNITMMLLMWGWNYLHRYKYPEIKYQAKEIISFLVLFFLVAYFSMTGVGEKNIFDEWVVSIVEALIVLLLTYVLLGENEKIMLKELVLKRIKR